MISRHLLKTVPGSNGKKISAAIEYVSPVIINDKLATQFQSAIYELESYLDDAVPNDFEQIVPQNSYPEQNPQDSELTGDHGTALLTSTGDYANILAY